MKACEHGYRVAFATAQEWVSRLEAAQDRNQLENELRRLERYHLLIVDEVGYLPLERQAANLLFALVSRRYERGSIIVTCNRGFEQWGEILGDAMVAAALIDRLVHHATMITLKGKSYRLRETRPRRRARRSASVATRLRLSGGEPGQWCTFRRPITVHFSTPLEGLDGSISPPPAATNLRPRAPGDALREFRTDCSENRLVDTARTGARPSGFEPLTFGSDGYRQEDSADTVLGARCEKPPEPSRSVRHRQHLLVLFGSWLALTHLLSGVLMCVTIVAIPLGLANFKLIPVSLFPMGREIVSVDRPEPSA